jgi:hypothetical protein
MSERILVCGGRDYADQAMLFGVLDMESEARSIYSIIQGGADGADRLARLWCHSRRVRYDNFPADWRSHGKAAGPIRNQQMLDEGKPTKVFAFLGGRGTADMVRRAKKAGVPVFHFDAIRQKGSDHAG